MKTGRHKLIDSPEQLIDMFERYKDKINGAPILKQEMIKGGPRAGDIVELEYQRPYTWAGFQTFIYKEVGLVKLEDYRTNKQGRYADFQDAIDQISSEMFSQKLEGAAVGIFQHNIIAMELGLAQKHEQKMTVEQPLFPALDPGEQTKELEGEDPLELEE